MYIRCQSLKIIFSVSKDFQLFGEAKEGYYGLLWKLAYSHSYIHTKIHTYIYCTLWTGLFSSNIEKLNANSEECKTKWITHHYLEICGQN